MARLLEGFLDGTCGECDWDDFISVMRFDDPLLEQIRFRCSRLDQEFPPRDPHEYCDERGRDVIRNYARQLKAKA